MGPVFGMKGGAAGGGYAQVVPMTDINLHFTGDFAAIAAANNLLAALIDNHVHHGNALDIDVRSITWKRVVDLNDRALRQTVVGLGGTANGYPREDGFDIVVASELMAIFCLAESLVGSQGADRPHRRRPRPVQEAGHSPRTSAPRARSRCCSRTRSPPTSCRPSSTRRPSCTADRSPTSRTAATR